MTREQMLKRIEELGGLTRPNCLKVVIEKYREMMDDKEVFDELVEYYTSEIDGDFNIDIYALSHHNCSMCELYKFQSVYKFYKYDCKKCGLRCESDDSIYQKVWEAVDDNDWKGFKTTCEEMITKCQELLRECEKE